MMAKLLRAAILMVFVLSAEDVIAATTHYLSNSAGADTNNGEH